MILTTDKIREGVCIVSKEYPIKKVSLFGSYAEGNSNEDSDVDLLIEFSVPHVSLLDISGIKLRLQDIFGKNVDVVHAPLEDNAMIEIGKELALYEA